MPANLHAIRQGLTAIGAGLQALSEGVQELIASLLTPLDVEGVFLTTANHLTAAQANLWSADSSQGTFVCNFYIGDPDETNDLTFGDEFGYFVISIDPFNGVEVILYSDFNGVDYDYFTFYMVNGGVDPFFTAGWHTLAVSWDTNFSAGNKVGKIVIDRVQQTSLTVVDASPAFEVELDGSDGSSTWLLRGGAEVNDFGIAEVWMKTGVALDVETSTVLDKFFTADNKPVDVGSDGSTPTGSAPDIYLSVRDGGAANDILTNRGTLGNFADVGTLELSTTSPSD